MNRLTLPLLLLLAFALPGMLRAQEAFQKEYIVITGGPSLIELSLIHISEPTRPY